MDDEQDESAPLNGRSSQESAQFSETTRDINKQQRDPLWLTILYTLSFTVSISGLGCGIWGYHIAVHAPFDEWGHKQSRESYEKHFYGMQSVVVFLTINSLWTGYNLYLTRQGQHGYLWPLNMLYNFLIWALLIAFGVLNMVEALWDRRLCDGWGNNMEMYARCDISMFQFLVVELVCVNLGLLVAVLHFILLVGSCCTINQFRDGDRALWLRRRIRYEESVLMDLMERRRALTEETDELEARRVLNERPLPPAPTDSDSLGGQARDERPLPSAPTQLNRVDYGAQEERPLPPVPNKTVEERNKVRDGEDLIDIAASEQERLVDVRRGAIASSKVAAHIT